MPLDLKKVINQIKTIEENNSKNKYQLRFESTYNLFKIARESTEKLINRAKETQITSGANFFYAIPYTNKDDNASIDTIVKSTKDFSAPHVTIATDGSQIVPSSHEFTTACLINIGFTVIPYFNNLIPVELSSEPTIYSSIDDLYSNTFSENIHEEYLISYERTLKEVEGLVKIAKKYHAYKIPIVALLDGTLIHWHLEKFSELLIKKFIERFSNAIIELKSLNIPVAGFLSNSRSNDFINMLRIFKCPYDLVNCNKYCSTIEDKNLPCNPCFDYKPVLDRKIIGKWFTESDTESGDRTILFKSNSKILNYYPDDLKVLFFYMNSGGDIARVELPHYVADNTELLTLLHNAISLQCNVGFGYPVTLSEAHLQAVINKTDRELFYNMLKEHLLKTTKTSVKISNKELRKRVSIV